MLVFYIHVASRWYSRDLNKEYRLIIINLGNGMYLSQFNTGLTED